jgi:gluconate 5-dehydrogenase
MSGATPKAFDLSGHVILLTGAARGLGFEMARALAQAGGHVVINGRDGARTEEAAARVRAEGGAASAAAFDVTDVEHAVKAIAAVAA